MTIEAHTLGFPSWLCITHFVNFLFLTLLVRSGIQILSDHPRLYFSDDCTPDSEWIKFTKKKVPRDRLYTSHEDEVDVSPWIALPGGRHNLGLGRHWHFFCAFFWMLNGLIYVAFLFATNNWKRLIPTSWSIFPDAWKSFITYATFHIPPPSAFHPYDALQQLSYAFVVFVLAPLAMLTGPAMSPAISARFPWYSRLFGGRQIARSIHFLVMVAFVLFLILHVALVAIVHFPLNMERIVFGWENHNPVLAITVGMMGIAFVVAIHYLVTRWSNKKSRQVQRTTGYLTDALNKLLLYRLKSKQDYSKRARSPYFWVNGDPPRVQEWLELVRNNFSTYTLEIRGLVKHPLKLSLADLKNMPFSEQVTKHCCIQGWSGIAGWGGVHLSEIVQRCQPFKQARFLVFRSFQTDEKGVEYYNTLDIKEALYPQTILAYQMNGKDLPVEYGAPLRLRVETKLGFKMTKWIRSIEFVEDFRTIGLGQGGYREDEQFFDSGAQI